MNVRPIVISLNAICVLFILTQFNIWDLLLLFIIGGVIPGTDQAIPASVVLGLIAIFLATIVAMVVIRLEARTSKSLLKKHTVESSYR